jgi:GNAT superfamily N-acetyltransferase
MQGDERDKAPSIEADVVAAGLIEPLGADARALRFWRACDLTSMVEGALHVELEPRALDARTTRRWLTRLRRSYRPPTFDDDRRWVGRPFFLLHEGRRVGTILLGSTLARPWLPIHSLFVERADRGQGVATRALHALASSCVRHGVAGVRLGTHWTWQKSLRFYLSRGFWVYSWKRDVQLVLEPELPERRFAIDGNTASFEIARAGRLVRAFTAGRDGDRLELREAAWLRPRSRLDLRHYALGTFAVSLALAGWPLVRSEEHWARRFGSSDAGDPEGFAYKLGIFERLAADDGWVVDTPCIPALERWQAWERGEEHGRRTEAVRSIEIVLRERGLAVDDGHQVELAAIDHPWELESLLRSAATAASVAEWWEKGSR